MQSDDDPRLARTVLPVWSLLSLLLPGIAWSWAISEYYTPDFTFFNGSMGATGLLLTAVCVALPAGVVGLICSILALVRRERFLPLSMLGLIASFLPLVAVLFVVLLLF